MTKMALLKRLAVVGGMFGLLVLWIVPARADSITDDPLHGFCYGVSTCADQNVATPVVQSSPLQFGFSISPGPQTGSLSLDILIPVTLDPHPTSLSFAITGSISGTATLFSTTAFTSGDLASYLGFAASSPANPIGGFQNAEQVFGDGKSTDMFYVYNVNLGTTTLQPNSSELSGPLFQISGGAPVDSSIVGFLNEGSNGVVATALSGQIITTPEPGTLSLLGVGLFGMIIVRTLRRSLLRS